MSIFTQMFRQQPQQPQQPQPQNQHVAANPQVPTQNNTPQQQPTAENPNPESPTDKFANLWQTPQNSQAQGPVFELPQERLQQAAQQIDFTRGASAEDMQAITQGGEAAVKALGNIMNTVARNVFQTNAQFTNQLTKSSYEAAQQQLNKGLPTLVTQQLSKSQLFESNPALRDPAVQPVVQALHTQLSQQHPEATPAEINSMLSEYMNRLTGAVNKPQDTANQQASQKASDNFDFSSFLQ